MKSIRNIKKIVAVLAGATLLGAGIAFAGPVTFQNVPIISSGGQPAIQIVVGSKAQITDGLAAGNIAAAVGNLAYTTVPVTAAVNTTEARAVLKVAFSSPKYSLTNQQVWLNESGSISSSPSTGGTYIFSALIGSVLNQGVQLGSPASTKTTQSSSTNYAFKKSQSTTTSPLASPYTAASYVPISTPITANNNGGGFNINSFTNSSVLPGSDNLLEVSSAQLNQLKSNWGGSSETEYLWLTGFPVYDQASGINSFQLLDAGGAYQIIFGKPIQNTSTSGSPQINQGISLLGQNYTIINGTGVPSVSSGNYSTGGKIFLASSLAPLQTVYVGKNLTSGPWTVSLTDLGQPNSTGVSSAAVTVYYKGVVTNTTQLSVNKIAKFNVSGNIMDLQVNQTFAGLYAYQKWAKLEMYTNVWQVQNGRPLNQTTNPGWVADLLWTNTTGGNKGDALYSLILYNSTPVILSAGQSLSFIQDPSLYKLTFDGDTLGSNEYDSFSIQAQSSSNQQYQNIGVQSATDTGVISNITEPAQLLVVNSQIPNAFSYAGTSSSSATYDLTPYEINERGVVPSPTTTTAALAYNGSNPNTWVTTTYPLQAEIRGYESSSPNSPQITEVVQFNASRGPGNTTTLATPLYNVTGIQVLGNRALPVNATDSFSIDLYGNGNTAYQLASLNSVPLGVIYPISGRQYDGFAPNGQVIYNQQNGQPTTDLQLRASTSNIGGSGMSIHEYDTFQINETEVPGQLNPQESLGIGIFNSTSGVGTTPALELNYSESGTKNNATYQSGSYLMNAQVGFRTERGSKIASISPSQVVFDLATAVDQLRFTLGSSAGTTTNAITGITYTEDGPYGIGQVTNLANISIAKITGNLAVNGSSNYSITGINNITATPSVSSATTPVLLNTLPNQPLIVLDSQANPSLNLILIGSGYVNTLSQQVQTEYNVSITPTSAPIVQAYGTNRILVAGYYANQTTAASNQFITDLYQAAASS